MNKPTLTARTYALLPIAALLGSAFISGCTNELIETTPIGSANADSDQVAVSDVALKIEKAGRMIERGEDASAAKGLLNQALATADITAEERVDAVLNMSRAHEVAGDNEQAITVVEQELANRAASRRNLEPLRKRLRELLQADNETPNLGRRREIVSSFASALSSYVQVDGSGQHVVRFFMAGGEQTASQQLGTFNVQGALKEQREQKCPLCDDPFKVSAHVRQSNWLVIPESQSQFPGAFLVFYFDLGQNRIPERYQRHLPMPVREIVSALEAGKSFTMAKERPGSPPAILIAAPRTAMLVDVEKRLADMTELPMEPVYVPVSRALRPFEIRGTMNHQMKSPLSDCYNALREKAPNAAGKLVIKMVIEADGSANQISVDAQETNLAQPAFIACTEKAAEKLQFPTTDGTLAVSYPFVLSPE